MAMRVLVLHIVLANCHLCESTLPPALCPSLLGPQDHSLPTNASCVGRGWLTSALHRTHSGELASSTVHRVVYAEHFGSDSDDWGDRINAAVQAADLTGIVQLPLGRLELSTPVKIWRLRRTSPADDTMAANISLARIGDVWKSVKGGRPADTAAGLVLQGVAGSAVGGASTSTTSLVWVGPANQVMIDMPAPWRCRLSDFSLDGNSTPGLVGIRYRPGYEFGRNGGKENTFERLSINRVDVGIDVGAPLNPDLVGSSFQQLEIHSVRIGIRFFGGDVIGHWVTQSMIYSWTEAAIKLQGYTMSEAVPDPTAVNKSVLISSGYAILRDADGYIVPFSALPTYARERMLLECPPFCAAPSPSAPRRRLAPGGCPQAVFRDIVGASDSGWFIDSNGAATRLEEVHLEGLAGVMRNTGQPDGVNANSKDRYAFTREASMLTNVGESHGSDPSVVYDSPGTLIIIGGSYGGNILLGSNASAWSLGTKFPDPPVDGQLKTFRQLQGTTGAIVHELPPAHPADPPPQGSLGTTHDLESGAIGVVESVALPSEQEVSKPSATAAESLAQRIQRLEDENEELKTRLMALEARLPRE